MEIAPGVFWDTQKQDYEQTPEAQELINAALQNSPLNKETERCGDGSFSRMVWGIYPLPMATLKVNINYSSSPNSNDWGGIKNKFYTVYAE